MKKKLGHILDNLFRKESVRKTQSHILNQNDQAPINNIAVSNAEKIYTITNSEQAALVQQCAPDKCWECPNVLC